MSARDGAVSVTNSRGVIAKVAMVRRLISTDTAVPPLYLNCPCGANPETTLDGPDVRCSCGKVYAYNGWVRE